MISAILNYLVERRSPTNPIEIAIGRKMRSFDIEMIAPFDHKALVAFLKADKLSELTTEQIRVFLMLRDTVASEGLSAAELAAELDITPAVAQFSITALNSKGYVRRSSVKRYDALGQQIIAWVYDGDHWAADDDMLYWEFGEI